MDGQNWQNIWGPKTNPDPVSLNEGTHLVEILEVSNRNQRIKLINDSCNVKLVITAERIMLQMDYPKAALNESMRRLVELLQGDKHGQMPLEQLHMYENVGFNVHNAAYAIGDANSPQDLCFIFTRGTRDWGCLSRLCGYLADGRDTWVALDADYTKVAIS